MKLKNVFFTVAIIFTASSFAQPCVDFVFVDVGYEPAFCRLFAYQSGNAVAYASVSGGTPDYTYQWTNLANGANVNNSVWGGLNVGDYEIEVTDDAGCVLTDTITIDSLNPIAEFDIISAQLDINLESNAQVDAQFINLSQYYANPNDPNADTNFYWNLNHPFANWQISYDANEIIDTLYTLDGAYDICLVALNKNGCSDTTCKTITIHGFAESDELIFRESKFIVYPTTSNGDFFITNNSDAINCKIYIYDVTGKIVIEEKIETQNSTFEINEESGTYFYKILDDNLNQIQTGKLFVVNN